MRSQLAIDWGLNSSHGSLNQIKIQKKKLLLKLFKNNFLHMNDGTLKCDHYCPCALRTYENV